MWQHITEMAGGPGTLRVFVQPAVAILLGILHGVRDRHEGRPPYLLGLVTMTGDRLKRLGAGLRQIAIPLAIAVLASGTFQYIIRKRVYVGYAILYAVVFVAIPYFIARGIANRVAHDPHVHA